MKLIRVLRRMIKINLLAKTIGNNKIALCMIVAITFSSYSTVSMLEGINFFGWLHHFISAVMLGIYLTYVTMRYLERLYASQREHRNSLNAALGIKKFKLTLEAFTPDEVISTKPQAYVRLDDVTDIIRTLDDHIDGLCSLHTDDKEDKEKSTEQLLEEALEDWK